MKKKNKSKDGKEKLVKVELTQKKAPKETYIHFETSSNLLLVIKVSYQQGTGRRGRWTNSSKLMIDLWVQRVKT